jgi:hypothetical protein
MKLLFLLILTFSISIRRCNDKEPEPSLPDYNPLSVSKQLPPGIVDEASGICDSRNIASHLWIHNDSGNPSEIYLFSHDAEYKGVFKLPFTNRDWEDISIANDPISKESYIYLADIGDNNASYSESYIYKFKEPKSVNETIDSYQKISFRYSDGSRDAETILIDPITNDIFIISKREFNVQIYHLPFPQNTTGVNILEPILKVPYFMITSGGISSDGKEIMLRSYNNYFYWYRKENETVLQTLSRDHDKILPFVKESQEEGFCFDKNNNGFFSVGEKTNENENKLYYFRKKTE